MPVFRVEKNTNYTTMSNYHLQDRNLSLKAKGLLSQFLSLPDSWHYNVKGLVKLNRDGKAAIESALKELEQHVYVRRRQLRDETGHSLMWNIPFSRRHKGGTTGFDTSMNRLQAQGYVVISNFVYMKDRHGKEYGWGVAEYSTPENSSELRSPMQFTNANRRNLFTDC